MTTNVETHRSRVDAMHQMWMDLNNQLSDSNLSHNEWLTVHTFERDTWNRLVDYIEENGLNDTELDPREKGHRYCLDTDRCVCDGQIVYFYGAMVPRGEVGIGYGCAIADRPFRPCCESTPTGGHAKLCDLA